MVDPPEYGHDHYGARLICPASLPIRSHDTSLQENVTQWPVTKVRASYSLPVTSVSSAVLSDGSRMNSQFFSIRQSGR